MKKLMVVACLCVAAYAAVPIASASAFEGKCSFEGNAAFENPLPPGVPAPNKYEFKGEKVKGGGGPGNSCEEAGGEKYKVEEVRVEGKGELACGFSENMGLLVGAAEPGEGKLKLEKGEKGAVAKAFVVKKFEFLAVGVRVGFEAELEEEGGVKAKATVEGEANFGEPGAPGEKLARGQECAKGELKELPFFASAST
jgi:hypothetical protein